MDKYRRAATPSVVVPLTPGTVTYHLLGNTYHLLAHLLCLCHERFSPDAYTSSHLRIICLYRANTHRTCHALLPARVARAGPASWASQQRSVPALPPAALALPLFFAYLYHSTVTYAYSCL